MASECIHGKTLQFPCETCVAEQEIERLTRERDAALLDVGRMNQVVEQYREELREMTRLRDHFFDQAQRFDEDFQERDRRLGEVERERDEARAEAEHLQRGIEAYRCDHDQHAAINEPQYRGCRACEWERSKSDG